MRHFSRDCGAFVLAGGLPGKFGQGLTGRRSVIHYLPPSARAASEAENAGNNSKNLSSAKRRGGNEK